MATITIDPNDLAAHSHGTGKPVVLSRTRKNETELPKSVELSYPNLNYDYEIGHEAQTRQITISRSHITTTLPIAFTPTEAAQVADILMANYWVERVQYEFSLPFFKYWRIEPTDILQITYEGTTHSVRVTDISYDIAYVIKIKGVANEQSIYTSNAIGGAGELAPGSIPIRGPTFGYLLNLPTISNAYAAFSGYWYGVTGIVDGWHSAALYRSDDGGTTYDLTTISNTEIFVGTTTDVLEDGKTNVWDTISRVNISMLNGTPVSDTDTNVMAGSNQAYINGEIIAFANASLISGTTYRLSRLLRGLYGTDHYTSAQTAGSDIFLLSSTFEAVTLDSSFRDVAVPHKIVGFGNNVEETAITSFTGTSLGLDPLAPVHIKGSRSAGAWVITWIRCNRVEFEWVDSTDIPMSESSELYDVDIYDGASVVRTYSNRTSETVTYPASTQITDFGAWQDTLTIEVFQRSGTVGRGIGRQVTLT